MMPLFSDWFRRSMKRNIAVALQTQEKGFTGNEIFFQEMTYLNTWESFLPSKTRNI